MFKFVLKRLLWMIPTILGVVLIIFCILELMPGDPALNALGTNFTEETYQQKREEMGLNDPFLVRYAKYLYDFFTKFDLGNSYTNLRPVGTQIKERLPTTMKLGIYGSLITLIVGIFVGIISAVKQYSIIDYVSTVLATFFASVPGFWLALMGIVLFSQKLKILPASGLDTWKHWIMPVICLGITPISIVVRMTRSSMLDVIRQDYIRTARAKGVAERSVIYKHALRNALIPVITIIGGQMGTIFGGSAIIETIFSIPGMGLMMLNGINGRDYPVIAGTVLVLSLAVCIINLLVDIAYGFADPRIKAQYVSVKKDKKEKPAAAKAEEAA